MVVMSLSAGQNRDTDMEHQTSGHNRGRRVGRIESGSAGKYPLPYAAES